MSNTQPIEEQPEAGQPCATCAGIELIADPDEHWQYRNGEPMAPDAAAFLEYLRGVEQRLVAAEARGAELEAASELAIDKWADAARSETQLRLDAAEARVAELEAQLVAQGWRPVTEKPTAHDSYLVYRAVPPRGEPWNYEFGIWDDTGWDVSAVTHWRPLPPAPQETEYPHRSAGPAVNGAGV